MLPYTIDLGASIRLGRSGALFTGMFPEQNVYSSQLGRWIGEFNEAKTHKHLFEVPLTPKRSHHFLILCLRVLSDVAAIVGAYCLAVSLSIPETSTWGRYAQANLLYIVVFTVVWIGTAADQRLFVSRRSETLVSLLFSIAKALFGAALFSAFVIELLESYGLQRRIFIPFIAFALCTLVLTRLATGISLWNLRRRGYNHRRILLVGANERSAHLAAILLANEQYGYMIEGFLENDEERRPILEEQGLDWLGRVEDLESMLVTHVLDAVYISLPVRSFYEQIQSIAHLCEGVGVPVRFLADLFPLRMATSQVTRINSIPLLSLSFEREIQTTFALRRMVDIMAALLLVTILAPAMLLIALAILIESRGPVFVWRTGHGGVRTLAFRTAPWRPANAGKDKTRVGRFIERYGLDELPQLLMVLAGRDDLGASYLPRGGTEKRDSSA